jgi:hypothetical protein
LQSRAHLAGGLVGEGHRQDRPRWHALDFVEPADPVGEYAGLAGAGTGQHQVVAGRGAHGFALRVVERIDQVRDIHRTHCSGAAPYVRRLARGVGGLPTRPPVSCA